MWRRAWELLPESIRQQSTPEILSDAEEIRLRLGRQPSLLKGGREHTFSKALVTPFMLESILEKATGASIHAVIHALRNGYLSYRGIRIGVCGNVIMDKGGVEAFQTLTSLAVRIPRDYPNICRPFLQECCQDAYHNTLILSPPGGGKTTALRDMIRGLSNRGYRIAVADERNELASFDGAQSSFDLGAHTDILVGAPKGASVMMLLRTMNPQLLAMDEISSEEDCDAVHQILGCGVGLLATAHAADVSELSRRPLYSGLLQDRVFDYALTIRQKDGRRTYEAMRLTTC